jgi:uncharacterized membrane protein
MKQPIWMLCSLLAAPHAASAASDAVRVDGLQATHYRCGPTATALLYRSAQPHTPAVWEENQHRTLVQPQPIPEGYDFAYAQGPIYLRGQAATVEVLYGRMREPLRCTAAAAKEAS